MKVNKEIIHDNLPDIVEDLYQMITDAMERENELIQRIDYLSMDISRLAARLDGGKVSNER